MVIHFHQVLIIVNKINLLAILMIASRLNVQAQIQVFKVDRQIFPRSDTYGDDLHGLSPPLAQFGIGAVNQGESRLAFPRREDFENILLIGSTGVAVKTGFVEFETSCEYLCGDELEECHYSGLVSWQEQDIGVPLLAVSGLSGLVTGFSSFIDTQAIQMNDLSIAEKELVWPAHNFLAINLKDGESQFLFRYENDYSYQETLTGNQCQFYDYEGTGLSRLACNSAEALLEGQAPLLYSNADYNLPNVQLVNKFTIDDQQFLTVMLALKAYTAYGLLIKEDAKWRFIVKPADWAQIC